MGSLCAKPPQRLLSEVGLEISIIECPEHVEVGAVGRPDGAILHLERRLVVLAPLARGSPYPYVLVLRLGGCQILAEFRRASELELPG